MVRACWVAVVWIPNIDYRTSRLFWALDLSFDHLQDCDKDAEQNEDRSAKRDPNCAARKTFSLWGFVFWLHGWTLSNSIAQTQGLLSHP